MASKERTTTAEQPHVPLNVWPCAQTSAQWQRQGRYIKESFEHPGKMLPDLARRIVETYSQPGDLVVDPMCGIGTTLIEGAALGRRCIGVELEQRWADIATANLDHILDNQHRDLAEVRVGDARSLPSLLGDVAGTVDLIATSPPYACEVARVNKRAWLTGTTLADRDSANYSHDPSNAGHARGDAYRDQLRAIYAACFDVLRPGGLLVTVTKNMRQKSRLVDVVGITSGLARGVGFGYLQHNVALLAGIHDSGLIARPSFFQQRHARRACQQIHRYHLVVHEDVLVFVKPEECT